MKTPLLTLAALSLFAANSRAQDATPMAPTTQPAAPTTKETAPLPAAPGGYQMLVEAGGLILPGENGSPSAAEIFAPDENLRRQRDAVSRNAPALALARLALARPIERPLAQNYNEFSLLDNGRLRELARQFIQESDVRFADGDFVGALDSRLDCIQMGVAVSRGPFISMLVGVAIERIGRDKIAPIAAKLDAASLRVAAARLQKIEAMRAPYSAIVRLEGEETLRLTLSTLPDDATRAQYATAEGRKSAKISEKQARELLALSPEKLRDDNQRLFNTAAGAARVSPRLAAMVPFPHDLNSSAESSASLLRNPSLRFAYERSVAQNRLLQAAFELRAAKQDGAYPAEFAAPLDPFSDGKPLIYKLSGDSYTLYSIGPDYKDDGGRAILNGRTDFDPASGQLCTLKSHGFAVSAKGDILAPVF